MKTLLKVPNRPSLFWDTDPKRIDLKKNARYVIERILDYGNDREVAWLWHTYSPRVLRKTVVTSRNLSLKSRALWLRLTS